ncbi:MAG: DUF2798 domain-containing protein [Ramlibacter sp.]
MIPRRFEPMVFVFVLSGLMSLVVSGVSTLKVLGLAPGWAGVWMGAWATAWLVAFPVALVGVPLARRIVHRLVRGPGGL